MLCWIKNLIGVASEACCLLCEPWLNGNSSSHHAKIKHKHKHKHSVKQKAAMGSLKPYHRHLSEKTLLTILMIKRQQKLAAERQKRKNSVYLTPNSSFTGQGSYSKSQVRKKAMLKNFYYDQMKDINIEYKVLFVCHCMSL